MNKIAEKTIVAAGLCALVAGAAQAQTYTVIDLTPNSGNAVAEGISGGVAAGHSAGPIFGTQSRAVLWDASGEIDLHPSLLDDPTTGSIGRSTIGDIAGNLQVGAGVGRSTANLMVPMLWRGSAASATMLGIPFTHFGGQAYATDGSQIVGYAVGLDRDGTVQGPSHAMLWDAASGTPVDLGDAGTGAMAYGVGGGAQVGYVIKGMANAALWRGSSRSLVVLHPKDAVLSVANATDGVRQVGYGGYDVRVRAEAAKGNKTQRFNYAFVWSGTAASAVNIHPYPLNNLPGVALSQSIALGLNGSWIVGYATDPAKTGTPAYNHAIVWSQDFQSVDLNAFLPDGFVGAQALSVDASGNVCGFMSKADGTRHAVVWVPTAAQ